MSFHKNGVFLMMVGNVFFAFLPVTVRLADRLGCSSSQTTFFRFIFAGLGVLALTILGWQKLRAVNTKALVWRGLFGALTILAYFLALHWTSAAKASLLNNTNAIWANVYAVIFLRHKPVKGFAPLLLMAVAGVWLVLGVGFASLNAGDVAGMLSGALAGGGALATREARRTDNALTVFASFTFFGFLFSGLFLWAGPWLGPGVAPLCRWTPLDGNMWMALLAMGATAMAGQLLFTQGCIHASLAAGTLLSLTVPVMAALLGIFVLHEPVAPHFVLGTVLVLAACGWFGWKARNESYPVSSVL